MFQSKRGYKFRWIVLCLGVWIVLGAYFCFYLPTSIHNSLKKHMNNIDPDIFEIYFAGLFSIYAFANIFLPFINGGLRDIIGDRFVILMNSVLIILGQSIFTYGIEEKSFLIMYIGRVLVGWGIESCIAIQSSFLSQYYKGDYLAFSIGMMQFFAYIGIFLCLMYCPVISHNEGVVQASMMGIYLNVIIFFTVIIVIILDSQAENQIGEYHQLQIQANNDFLQQQYQQQLQQQDEIEEEIGIQRQQEQEQQQQQVQLVRSQQTNLQPNSDQNNVVHRQGFFSVAFSTEQIQEFPRIFWLMSLYYATIYCSVISLVNVSVGFFTENWLQNSIDAEVEAGRMIAFMWLISGILTPIFGIMIDYVGQRSAISIFSAFICLVAHILVLLNQPFVGLFLLGFSLALSFAAIYTGIIYVIPVNALGKAYGILISMYNIGFTISPLVVGILRAWTKTFFFAQIFLAIIGLIALIVGILIYREDHYRKEQHIDNQQLIVEESDFLYSSVLHNQRQNIKRN